MVEIANIERFRSIIAARLGLYFEEAKIGFLGEVLRRRLELTQQSCADYLSHLQATGPLTELCAVARELTVGETYFFRNIDQFSAVSEFALPSRLRARASSRKLRILSAGCASGEEAYSLSILLKNAGVDQSWDISILAVDINPAMIDAALRARFSTWALRETPPEIQRQWLQSVDRGLFSPDPSLGKGIRFEVRNLVEADPELWQPETYDIIFCRNVIMYLTPEASRLVVARITGSLAPGGYLYLGHAETLRGLSQDFHLHHTNGTFYYQRKDHIEASFNNEPRATSASSPTAYKSPLLDAQYGEVWVEAIRNASERIQALANTQQRYPPGESISSGTSDSPKLDLALPLDLLEKEQFAKALDQLRALPPESANNPDVLLLHAVLLAHRSHFAAAQEVCHRLIEFDDLNAGAHYVLALCHEGLAEATEANHHYHVAIYLDANFAMPHLHLGLLARRKGDRSTAQRELQQALVLLRGEDASRLLLFGGGFGRVSLIALCRAELSACGVES